MVVRKPVSAEGLLRRLDELLGSASGAGAMPVARPHSPLSARERQVIAHVVKGRANREIAELMGLKEPTIKKHLQRILSKLNAKDRTQAAVEALRSGLAS